MNTRYFRGTSISVVALLFVAFGVTAKGDLFATIEQQDARLFDAFNACDVEMQAQIFSPDLEFYHDTAGVSNYEETLRATRQNCDKKLGLERTLISGSMRVYPIKNFGAIQQARHQFCHMENGKLDCGTFGFTHIWKRVNDTWLLHRVVSYDH
ncbi:MAG: nuclear transport factor 2 family protein [Aestuariibacter sp.]